MTTIIICFLVVGILIAVLSGLSWGSTDDAGPGGQSGLSP